jgi:hypothetical protein
MNQSKIYKIGEKLKIRVLKLLGLFTFKNNWRLSTHQKLNSLLRLGELNCASEQSQRR